MTTTTTSILVVDDEPKTLTVSSDILGMDGYSVDTARDGREALEKFEPGRHEAVITDLRMPGMSGIELVERIRERDADVPIVILTGYATVDTATRAVSAGAFEYLFKPIDFDKLKQTLRRAVERYRLETENRRLIAELKEANARLEAWSGELERHVKSRTRDLAHERDLLDNVVSAIPSGIAVLNAELTVLRENAAFQRLGKAGRALILALAQELRTLCSGGGGNPLPAPPPAEGSRTGSGGLSIKAREVVITEADDGVDWSFRAGAVALANGRTLLIADDTTDAAKREDNLVQVEKLLSLGTLAGGIVHDLANPITAILGTAELLHDEAPEPLRADIQAMISSAQYMREVCSGLTEFSRRARKNETIAVNANDVVEKAIAFARYGKKLANVAVETSLAPELPAVASSPSELTQVLVNLIVNASDAMASVPLGRPARIVIETAAVALGSGVRIRVADNGPGIPGDVRARIFEPFFTTKGAGKGTGLGLYTSRRILKRLGGRLDLETSPAGATFIIELPAAV